MSHSTKPYAGNSRRESLQKDIIKVAAAGIIIRIAVCPAYEHTIAVAA